MYKGKKIAVVVPAYDEERFISKVLETIPEYVDRVFVIDDASNDKTYEIAVSIASRNNKVMVVSLDKNCGVGGAITTGHKLAIQEDMDIVAIMAGDNQMDPSYLPSLLNPIIEGRADYTKGDRMSDPKHRKDMPKFRRFGTLLLTILTRISSGYWHINDPQNGYTAISTQALFRIPLNRVYKGFAFENDMLVRLNIIGAKVIDISHPSVYRDQVSKINYPKFVLTTSWILLTSWLWRLWVKYIISNRSNT